MAVICRNVLRMRNLAKDLTNTGKFSGAGFSNIVKNPSAGIIIIGDEILKAQVKDTNSHYICSLLYNCGVKVKKISVVGDEIDHIANEIVDFSKKYTYVITSGGIGPTHDDVTFEALAKAFAASLHYHPKLVEIVGTFSNSQDVSSPAYKLAYIPACASLRFGNSKEASRGLSYPCVNVENVYVFPGSPLFLEKLFRNVYKELFATDKNFVTQELYLSAREELFADNLAAIAKEFPHVTFGSYPTMNHSYYSARVTIESSSKEETEKAVARFRELAPSHYFINYDSDPLKEAVKKFKTFVSTDKQGPLYEATLTSLNKICNPPSTVVLCFDGSIETTILLHFAHINDMVQGKDRIRALYFKPEKPFGDVDSFIKETVARYDLDIHILEGSFEVAIKEFLAVRPEIRTLLLGLKNDKVTGGPWHELARIGKVYQARVKVPLSEWTYRDVWNLVRSLSLPYCKLYDLGYTSLGNPNDTKPNPNLVRVKTVERTEYNPAYMLNDLSLERAGRNRHDDLQTRKI